MPGISCFGPDREIGQLEMAHQLLSRMEIALPVGKTDGKGKEKKQGQQQDLGKGASYENFTFYHVIHAAGRQWCAGRTGQWMTQSLFGTGCGSGPVVNCTM